MTFKEWNIRILSDKLLGGLLPMELRRTYPRLSVEDGKLCGEFIGLRTVRADSEVKAEARYYLKITYPQCRLLAYHRLSSGACTPHSLPSSAPEQIRQLASRCDDVLQSFDARSEDFAQKLTDYCAALEPALAPEQLTLLDRFAGL